jgi:hypothetical protein
MDTKFFLNKYDSKTAFNTSGGLDIELKGRKKLLPLGDIGEVISQYDQYVEEREKCNIIRLTCQINPICSNVLFNRITEIVKDEGSENVAFINYGIGENSLFENVPYKPHTMEFWSGNTMDYFSTETAVGTLSEDSSSACTNSIRDTELSSSDVGFTYHCGFDIFNNHLIRSKTFKTICRYLDDDYQAFNTMFDLMRDVNGNNVVENLYFPTDAGVAGNKKEITMHLYEYDDIDSFEECYKTKLIKKYNGWLGFYNRSKIKSYKDFQAAKEVGDELKIERPIMNVNGGDFVDMYPSRDLYSFIPKFNPYRNRIEKNWNYCITYPSSSFTPYIKINEETGKKIYSPFSDIIECNDGINSLKAVYFDENTRADNGTSQIVIYSIAKHGLSVGDYVNIYKTYVTDLYWVEKIDINSSGTRVTEKFETEEEANDAKTILDSDNPVPEGEPSYFKVASKKNVTVNKQVLNNAEVTEVVDDYIFTVFGADIQIGNYWVLLTDAEKKDTETPLEVVIDEETKTFKLDTNKKYYISADVDDPSVGDKHYYIVNGDYVNFDDKAQRISYKKVVNDIECDYYIRIFSRLPNFKYASGDTSNEYQIYRNNAEMIDTYQDREYEFENHISRLAFAKNIYSDGIGELVFTDDIDISNIKDNLGRPITDLYITFIKNNMGYKEWYGFDYPNWSEDKISGDTVEYSHCFGKITCGIETSIESKYEKSISSIYKIHNLNADPCFGYLVGGYINPSARTYNDGDNVVQIPDEEIWYNTDKHFYGDLCYYDGYNAVERPIQQIMQRFNTAQRETDNTPSGDYFKTYCYDEIAYDDYDTSQVYSGRTALVEGVNAFKEGYYYAPHYKIPIKTFDKLQTIVPDFLTMRRLDDLQNGRYSITTLQQHFLSPGDKTMIYNKETDEYYDCITVSGTNDNYKVFTCKVYKEGTEEAADLTYPLNKYKLFKMDNLDVPSYARVLKDGTCRIIWRNVINNGLNKSDDTVEEYPFTNGAFYINRNINIYVRRQDPIAEWGMYNETDVMGQELDISTEDNYVKDTEIEC